MAGVNYWLVHPYSIFGPILTGFSVAGLVYCFIKYRNQGGPTVEPLSYGAEPERGGECLRILGRGEPAYNVEVESVPLRASWILCFGDPLSRVDGEVFFSAVIRRGHEAITGLEDIWRKLQDESGLPGFLPLYLRYRDSNGHWWKSICELHRDVTKAGPGFEVRFIRRKRIRAPRSMYGEGTRRLAIVLGLFGALAGGFYARNQFRTTFSDLDRRIWNSSYFREQREGPTPKTLPADFSEWDATPPRTPSPDALDQMLAGMKQAAPASGPPWYSYLRPLVPVLFGFVLAWGATHCVAWVIRGFAEG